MPPPLIRRPTPAELDALPDLVLAAQADVRRRVPLLDERSRSTIAAELAEVEDLAEVTRVAVEPAPDGVDRVVAALVVETDLDVGRAWHLGPFVRPGIDDAAWDDLADALLAAVRAEVVVPRGIEQEEVAASGDLEDNLLARFALRHGFAQDPASLHLSTPLPLAGPVVADAAARLAALDGVRLLRVAELDEPGRAAVAALHDACFPAGHRDGRGLVADRGDRHDVVAAVDRDGEVSGYVAVDLPAGDDVAVYVDFVGVAEAVRGRGLGGALVVDACRRAMAAGAARATLTVRLANAPARALYERLGFVADDPLTPFRKGFSLA